MRKCIFCGRDDLTKEHIFPNWLNRYFKKNTSITNTLSLKDNSKIWKSNILNSTLKVVCRSCNNGWMSSIESTAIKIIDWMGIKGQGINLTNSQKQILSVWATKTIYVMCQLKFGSKTIPVEHYKYFYQHKTPSPGTAIFIGYREKAIQSKDNQFSGFHITKLKRVHVKDPLDLPFLEEQMKLGKHFYLASLAIGYLSLVLVSHDFAETDILGKLSGGYIQMIWPLEGEKVRWPSTSSVDKIGGWDGLHKTLSESIYVERRNPNNIEFIPF